MATVTGRRIPDRYGEHDLSALISLYESNYVRLTHLVPDLAALEGTVVSKVAGALDLHLTVEERFKYTTTISLTYSFDADAEEEPVLEPNARICVYHDVRAAELLGHSRRRRFRRYSAWQRDRMPLLERKWEMNRFLFKWLRFCSHQGHLFLNYESTTQVTAESRTTGDAIVAAALNEPATGDRINGVSNDPVIEVLSRGTVSNKAPAAKPLAGTSPVEKSATKQADSGAKPRATALRKTTTRSKSASAAAQGSKKPSETIALASRSNRAGKATSEPTAAQSESIDLKPPKPRSAKAKRPSAKAAVDTTAKESQAPSRKSATTQAKSAGTTNASSARASSCQATSNTAARNRSNGSKPTTAETTSARSAAAVKRPAKTRASKAVTTKAASSGSKGSRSTERTPVRQRSARQDP